MEQYYSSDEEIAWGPPTVKETKRYLTRPAARKVERRHTILCSMADSEEDSIPEHKALEVAENAESDDKFLEITGKNAESDENSSYAKITLDSDSNTGKELFISVSSGEENERNSCNKCEGEYMVDKENDQNNCNKYDEEQITEEFHSALRINSFGEEKNKGQIICDTDSNPVNKQGKELDSKNFNYIWSSPFLNNQSITSYNTANTTETDSTSCSSKETTYSSVEQGLNTCDKKYSEKFISPVKVPDINISQFDSSSDFTFNDTLEEMNRLLEQGNDYVTVTDNKEPKVKILAMSPIRTPSTPKIQTCLSEPHKYFTSSSNMTGKNLSNKNFYGCKTTEKSQFYLTQKTPKSQEKKKLVKDLFPPSNSLDKVGIATPKDTFKHPVQLAKIRSPATSNKYKHIKSPISIYIHNSPSVMCLKQNVPVRAVSKLQSPRRLERTPNNNSDTLPEVIYRPAKHQVVKNEPKINLPSNIKRLVKEPVITKHEVRIRRENKNIAAKMELCETDLTTVSIDPDSFSVSNQDVSIVTCKQAFVNDNH